MTAPVLIGRSAERIGKRLDQLADLGHFYVRWYNTRRAVEHDRRRRGGSVTAPGQPASHVRKARRASRLACGCYVTTGHPIARVAGRWVCIECALAARKATEHLMREPPQPSERDRDHWDEHQDDQVRHEEDTTERTPSP